MVAGLPGNILYIESARLREIKAKETPQNIFFTISLSEKTKDIPRGAIMARKVTSEIFPPKGENIAIFANAGNCEIFARVPVIARRETIETTTPETNNAEIKVFFSDEYTFNKKKRTTDASTIVAVPGLKKASSLFGVIKSAETR